MIQFDHEILLKKLYYYGFREKSQFVEIKQQRSFSFDVKIGVPQGCTLGPLLFILYINDLNKSLSMPKSIHFADDPTLYLDINPFTVPTSLINSELAQVQMWINANKLSLNVRKTNYMII